MSALESRDVETLCAAIDRAAELLRTRQVNELECGEIGRRFVQLAEDKRSQVRRAVALGSEHLRHPTFREVAERLTEDDHSQVRGIARGILESRSEGRRGDLSDPRHMRLLQEGLLEIDARSRAAARRLAERHAETLMLVVDHEMSKVLQPLLLGLESLSRSLVASDANAEECRQSAARACARVAVLRSISKSFCAYTAEVVSVTRRPEPVRELLDNATRLVMERLRIKKRAAFTEVAFEVDLPSVEVQRERVVQGLATFLQNAFEAYGDQDVEKRILVSAERDGPKHVRIRVTDWGGGMTEEMKRRAFDLGASSKGPGRGFGLPVALQILEEEHGGRISVDSERGKGTTVTVRLPVGHVEEE